MMKETVVFGPERDVPSKCRQTNTHWMKMQQRFMFPGRNSTAHIILEGLAVNARAP